MKNFHKVLFGVMLVLTSNVVMAADFSFLQNPAVQTIATALAIFTALNGLVFALLKQSSIPAWIGFTFSAIFISMPLMA